MKYNNGIQILNNEDVNIMMFDNFLIIILGWCLYLIKLEQENIECKFKCNNGEINN